MSDSDRETWRIPGTELLDDAGVWSLAAGMVGGILGIVWRDLLGHDDVDPLYWAWYSALLGFVFALSLLIFYNYV